MSLRLPTRMSRSSCSPERSGRYAPPRLLPTFTPLANASERGVEERLESATLHTDHLVWILCCVWCQMEAKLNNQSAMMMQLRDENLSLKERCQYKEVRIQSNVHCPSRRPLRMVCARMAASAHLGIAC